MIALKVLVVVFAVWSVVGVTLSLVQAVREARREGRSVLWGGLRRLALHAIQTWT